MVTYGAVRVEFCTSNKRIATKSNERMCRAVPKPKESKSMLSESHVHTHTRSCTDAVHSHKRRATTTATVMIFCAEQFDASQSSSYAIWEYQWICIHSTVQAEEWMKGQKGETERETALHFVHYKTLYAYVENKKCGGDIVMCVCVYVTTTTKSNNKQQQQQRKRRDRKTSQNDPFECNVQWRPNKWWSKIVRYRNFNMQ